MNIYSEQRRFWLSTAFAVLLCTNYSAHGFTGLNIGSLSTQLRLFGYEIASLFNPSVANTEEANKLRARLALPRRSYYYNGQAHPYRLHDYVREEEQEEMRRLQAEGRRWKLRNSLQATETSLTVENDAENSVDQRRRDSVDSDVGNSPMRSFRDYFRRVGGRR